MTKYKECPVCEGLGHFDEWGEPPTVGWDEFNIPCSKCQGLGTVPDHTLPTHQWVRLPPSSHFKHWCKRCGTYKSQWSSPHCWTPSPLASKLMQQLRLHGLRCRATQHKVYVWPNRRKKWHSTQEFDARHHNAIGIVNSFKDTQ